MVYISASSTDINKQTIWAGSKSRYLKSTAGRLKNSHLSKTSVAGGFQYKVQIVPFPMTNNRKRNVHALTFHQLYLDLIIVDASYDSHSREPLF